MLPTYLSYLPDGRAVVACRARAGGTIADRICSLSHSPNSTRPDTSAAYSLDSMLLMADHGLLDSRTSVNTSLRLEVRWYELAVSP